MKHIVDVPGNLSHLDEIYVYISRDDRGLEGILGYREPWPGGSTVAMVTGDKGMLSMFAAMTETPEMKEAARVSKHTFHLLKFTKREELS